MNGYNENNEHWTDRAWNWLCNVDWLQVYVLIVVILIIIATIMDFTGNL